MYQTGIKTNLVSPSYNSIYKKVIVVALLLFLFGCSPGADNVSIDPSLDQPPPNGSQPSVSLSASASTVTYGDSVTLSWSSTDADQCTASGDWDGIKNLSGNELLGPLTNNSNFTILCSNTNGSTSRTVSIVVQALPLPTVNLSASATSIVSGGSITLNWNSTDADQCTASGDWTGNKAKNGSKVKGPLTTDQSYTLTCSNSSGSVSDTVNVTVIAPDVPNLTFNTNTSSVENGGTVILSWAGTNVDNCTANGDWAGVKATSGNETLGPLTISSTFGLSCSGAGGTVNGTVNVTVSTTAGDGISGFVDSTYINRLGMNRIYIYAGHVAPDDIDGDSGDPLRVVDVIQTPGSCNFNYAVTGLSNGDYTLAFTGDGAKDKAGQNDSLLFKGVYQFTYSGSALQHNLIADSILRVGPTRAYNTIQSAVAVANEGDVIEVDAGDYPDDIIVFRTDYLTVRGVGGHAHVRGTYVIPYSSGNDLKNGMGLWVNRSTGLTVENVEFSNARVVDENGAGIRNLGQDLTVCNGYFHHNEDGLLGGAYGTLLIEYSEFNLNGWTDLGRNHNMYIDEGDTFILRHSYSHHAKIGHNVKTRAKENHILYNRIMDENDGTSSYDIDVPNGGLTYIIGNLIQQGPNTDNSTMVTYGAEGLSGDGRTNKLYVINNTMVNDNGSGTFLDVNGSTLQALSTNNIFTGGGSTLSGPGTESHNLITANPGLVDKENFDYRLQSGSAARDAGANPGQGEGVNLVPVYQYLHPHSRKDRPSNGAIDIGAYEY